MKSLAERQAARVKRVEEQAGTADSVAVRDALQAQAEKNVERKDAADEVKSAGLASKLPGAATGTQATKKAGADKKTAPSPFEPKKK